MFAFFYSKSIALVLALLPIVLKAYSIGDIPFDTCYSNFLLVTPAIAIMQRASPHQELLSQTCKKGPSSLAPTSTPTSHVNAQCENDETFKFFYKQKIRTCKNIRINENRRKALCSVKEVNAACPQVCGSCCEDDVTYIFTRNNGLVGNCSWLAKKQERIDRYCHDIYKPYGNGSTVRDGCPVTCDFCFTGDKTVVIES